MWYNQENRERRIVYDEDHFHIALLRVGPVSVRL